ncbi:uncharacterized protein TRAVEDRAFT_38414 [Trametes versicolor FP-101664 SS1]|uniref:uncharacterized protein n=1 Tax=Trametes versicolor (strain FP-101664) TaxID=717944 RepID=UPI0004623D0F|nr:uncharacterized protein TRAVEDRAFT_38414 [Trametes versicolor FP-101664 SS1]EIW56441.1 hypothetical protein TRAVEDRAFT_38414 [Trametes versicolor FP-101664 SS1]
MDGTSKADGQACILDGRYANKLNPIPPPVEIFHPAFAAFIADSQNPNLAVPVEFLRKLPKLMTVLSKISTSEANRTAACDVPLQEALGFGLAPMCSGSGGQPDLGRTYTRVTEPLGTALLTLIEEKSEPGNGNDPCVQASFAYANYWTSNVQRELLMACFAPSFLIGFAGPSICICAGIYPNSHIVHHTLDHAKILRIGRIFWAFKMATERLQKNYVDLRPPEDDTRRFYPLATQYRRGEDTIDFEYIGFLKSPGESCAIFLARECRAPQRKIVVKFVERYGAVAHTLLADKGLAPPLLYFGDIWLSGPEQRGCGIRKMVVMVHVEGQTLLDAMPVTPDGQLGPTPAGVYTAVRRAVDALQAHDPPLVHGDIRYINILIAADKEGAGGSVEVRVRIIDFDWAGVAGEVRYPFNLSADIRWPEGASDYAPIMAAHDDEMAEHLR